jgi:hypothetical protein
MQNINDFIQFTDNYDILILNQKKVHKKIFKKIIFLMISDYNNFIWWNELNMHLELKFMLFLQLIQSKVRLLINWLIIG